MIVTCVAGVRKGRGRELGRETAREGEAPHTLSRDQIRPSPSSFNACLAGYNDRLVSLFLKRRYALNFEHNHSPRLQKIYFPLMCVAKCLSLRALMCGTRDPCKFESSWSNGWSDRQIIERHKFDHSTWDSVFRRLNARDKNLVVLNVAWTLIWFCFLPGPPRRLVLRFPSGSPTVLSASCTADVKGRTILPLARRGLVAQITHVQCYGLLIRDLEILRQGRLRGRDFLSTK